MAAVFPRFASPRRTVRTGFFIRYDQRTKMCTTAFWFRIACDHYFSALNVFYFQPFLAPVSSCIMALFFLGDDPFQSLFLCRLKKRYSVCFNMIGITDGLIFFQ